MNNNMKIALAEVNSILETTEEDIYSKIPQSFKEYVKTNMDKEFKPNIIPGLAIFAQPISLEAKELLRLVYRDFLANKEERDILIKKEEQIILNSTKTEEINSNNVVEEENKNQLNEIKEENNLQETNQQKNMQEEKQNTTQIFEEKIESVELVVVEEKWYKKLFRKILNIVKRPQM